jgi:tetratricopeptide (TPR) repeat protein
LVLITIIITTSIFYLQRKNNSTTESIEAKTDNINTTVVKVFNRFDQLEGAIKNANPIANPKTANDFIVNAYIFKNAGETEKAIDMFTQYFKKTKTARFDLYNDYYQLLKLSFSQEYAVKKTKAELELNMISAVIYYNEIYGNEALVKINKLKISKNLKVYLFLIKSNELKVDHISWDMYPFYVQVMTKRIGLGSQLECIKPFFFDLKGPLNLLRENHWTDMRDQIIANYSLYQYYVKTHNISIKKGYYKEGYAESMLSAAKLSESNPSGNGMTTSNMKAYIRCGTDLALNKKFRTMQ